MEPIELLNQRIKALGNKVDNKIEESLKEQGLLQEIRATFIVNPKDVEKLKAIAYWERLKMKDVADEMLKGYIKAYEEKNGKIMKQNGRPPLPEEKKKSSRLNVRFNPSQSSKLDLLSKKMGISKADVIRTLISEA